jgi:hypothetical protein
MNVLSEWRWLSHNERQVALDQQEGNEMALCMVERAADEVNINNRLLTFGVRITQRRKGGEWSSGIEGKALDGPLYDVRLQLGAVRRAHAGWQWQRSRAIAASTGRQVDGSRGLWCAAGDFVSKTAAVRPVADR